VIRSPETGSYDRVTELVWLGSRVTSVSDYLRLRAEGIRACVDMKAEGADPWGFEAFLWLPTPDHGPPRPEQLRLGLAFLRECEAAGMPVLVTCMAGFGRSSTLVLAHLLAGQFRERGTEEALRFLSACRGTVSPSPEQIEAARLAALSPLR
jgi:predicted protein tyrosine phosphatase